MAQMQQSTAEQMQAQQPSRLLFTKIQLHRMVLVTGKLLATMIGPSRTQRGAEMTALTPATAVQASADVTSRATGINM